MTRRRVPRSRSAIRRRQFLRHHRWLFVAVALVYAFASYLLVGGEEGPVRTYTAGVLAVAFLWLMLWVRSLLGSSRGLRHAVLADAWTASEVRGLGDDGWVVVDGLDIGIPDVNQVAVGSGGVLAFAGCWARRPLRVRGDTLKGMHDPLPALRRGAHAVEDRLAASGLSVAVVPALVVWGREPAELALDGTFVAGDVALLSGARADGWRPHLHSRHLEQATVDRIRDALAQVAEGEGVLLPSPLPRATSGAGGALTPLPVE